MKLKTKKRLFNDLTTSSLFFGPKTFTDTDLNNMGTFRYDLGKYKLDTRECDGTKIDCPVWYELRKDSDGPYLCIMTFEKRSVQLNKIWESIKNK